VLELTTPLDIVYICDIVKMEGRFKVRYLIISLLVLMLVTVSGCTTTEKGATYGGLLGAGAGAIIGNQSDHALGGAAIGGLAGAAAGALIGNTMEED